MTVGARQLGAWPGLDLRTALDQVLDAGPERRDAVTLPLLPQRGVAATALARTLACVSDLGFDLQPSGWRLTPGDSFDLRRARGRWRDDREVVEEVLHAHEGTLTLDLLGPWSLAARVELPRGGPVLGDAGARRDLAEAWAAGIAAAVGDLGRRLPGCALEVVVDEPDLRRVARGTVPTASGYRTLPAVDGPDLVAPLARAPLDGWLLDAPGGVEVAGRCGAAGAIVDVVALDAATLDAVAGEVEAGRRVVAAVTADTTGPVPEVGALVEAVVGPLRRLELGDRWGERLTLAVRTSAEQPVAEALGWWRRVLAAARVVGGELRR